MATTVAGTAHAQNLKAPDGVVILDLATNTDHTIHADTYTQYTTQFVANGARSTLTFAFRTDPGYFTIDNISVVKHLVAGNLIQNGGFETAATTGNPVPNWSYGIQPGIASEDTGSGLYSAISGAAAAPLAGSDAYVSGAFGGYDYISQSFNTTKNATYDVSFFLNWTDAVPTTGIANYSQTSTNGLSGLNGNGIDLVVYDQLPEPASLALFGIGAAAIGWVRRRRA
jgi:hypothetical protein